ncbi:hypothetical protein [Methylotuvimicrobium sp.]|uniref:RipA family octameric membrane protein n=1 Tax=Methylotuvimicrobium sp. TaxID=2822413 RepID=UPI003D64F2F0
MTEKRSDFEVALQMREFEITQLAQRNNFFMIFQGVLLAGVIQSAHSIAVVSFLGCVAGFSISLFQVGMASGAKYWQAKLSEFEPNLFHEDDCRYNNTVKGRLSKRGISGRIESLIMRRYSVSRISIWVGITFAAIWFLLVLCTLRGYSPLGIPSFIVDFNCHA